MKYFLPYFFVIIQFPLFGQLIDNTASYRNISSDRYFRFHYENDYFSETDEFYTQGINLEFVHPVISKFPLSRLVFNSSTAQVKNGISLEHIGFTPTSIGHNEILYGDRPFAAALFLKTFSIINDSVHKYRIASVLSTGVMGPAAGGEQMQQEIHRWIGDLQPLGWQNQVQNDLILNYQVDIEKNVLTYRNYLVINAKAGGMAGTLYDKASLGFVFMTGVFESPFQSFVNQKRKFQVYLYSEPKLSAIGYDATLQGGLFNRTSSYTIESKNINRIVFQHNFGIVFKIKRMNLEYFQSFLSQEFATQGTHRWGGIRIGYAF